MRSSGLRAKVRRRLAALGLPEYFDLATLHRLLEARLGRPIILRPRRDLAHPRATGATYREGAAIIVEYDPRCTPLQQEVAILHEFAHLICGHQRALVQQAEATGALAGAVTVCDLSTLRGHMRVPESAPADPQEEREAEVMADELLKRLISTAVDLDGGREAPEIRHWLHV